MKIFMVFLAITLASGYKIYQDNIPNGGTIPHPCKPNYIWQGVGHRTSAGGGTRNPFGEDFKAAGHKWTNELCQKDSDGDGKKNGVELGDPDCVWKKGDQPASVTDITHPGVCEPLDKTECAGKQDWMTAACKPDTFSCDALKDSGVKNYKIQVDKVPVPAKETTYMCKVFDAPSTDEDVHLIAMQPDIDNNYVMHHMVLFGCDDDVPVSSPSECGMSPGRKCFNILILWTLGSSGICMHNDAGIRLGGTKGYKKLALQYHWNNPKLKTDYADSSGMVLYYTLDRRGNDAGILIIGQRAIVIPPKKDRVEVTGTCPAQCTEQAMRGPIFVTAAFNHMHYLGISQQIEIWRDGKMKMSITNDTSFNYDDPRFLTFEKPFEIRPGDDIITKCTYKSTTKTTTTYFGESTSEEMCFGFLTYYPNSNLDRTSCISAGSTTTCKANNSTNAKAGTKYLLIILAVTFLAFI